MEEADLVGAVLNFLRKNKFIKAEAALCSEIQNHHMHGLLLQKIVLDETGVSEKPKLENGNMSQMLERPKVSSTLKIDSSKELIIKEIECGADGIRPVSTSEYVDSITNRSAMNDLPVDDKGFTFLNSKTDVLSNTNSWILNSNHYTGDEILTNGHVDTGEASGVGYDNGRKMYNSGKEVNPLAEIRKSHFGMGTTENNFKVQPCSTSYMKKCNYSTSSTFSNDILREGEAHSSFPSTTWKDCSVKTVVPFSNNNMCRNTNDPVIQFDNNEHKGHNDEFQQAVKEQFDNSESCLYFGSDYRVMDNNIASRTGFSMNCQSQKEELPRLPPVRLKYEEKLQHNGHGLGLNAPETSLIIGTYLDVPVGQKICLSGDGFHGSVDYPNDYWDYDEYDDDDDVGYRRQLIEDESWFLANDIDYPSDNEKETGRGSVPDANERGTLKEEEDQSFAEEDSYFSGEQYFPGKTLGERIISSDDPIGLSISEIYGGTGDSDLIAHYDGQLMDEEELKLLHGEPVWQGFVTQTNDLMLLEDKGVMDERGESRVVDICPDNEQHGSVRSIGVGINSDAADIGSEVRESLIDGSSPGDFDDLRGHDVCNSACFKKEWRSEKPNRDNRIADSNEFLKFFLEDEKDVTTQIRNMKDGGFSFPPPSRDGPIEMLRCSKSTNIDMNPVLTDEGHDGLSTVIGSDDVICSWRQKGSNPSPLSSSGDGMEANPVKSENSLSSTVSYYGKHEMVASKNEDNIDRTTEAYPAVQVDDEEAAAVQEQIRQIMVQEEEFETFNLKIVHRKNRTGFEEDKNFHVVLNSVIAGRYHVTEYLGSAAFSKAIQAHDLHTGIDVCVKIIKNNKDFFDQSLDEIKLLKFVNQHDPSDKYHILRLYDYFYYREHLLIVCELLKANLYEFHKFNRESGGEVYFTMPRLQSIAIQCLEALQFLHSLGLIHCDLKPENILVKSYSRCEVKVIDLGSSCFETDNLCSYVQSRSYRAPEVILGLPYDRKIDIWSLGCILAELCTGNVLFQNDSPATLLARVIGIIGPIDRGMLTKGRDTYKYFSKNHMLYERNQETNRMEYVIPKKSSLRHRMGQGDAGFVEFVSHLLEVNPRRRPSANEALNHAWLTYPYEPISS